MKLRSAFTALAVAGLTMGSAPARSSSLDAAETPSLALTISQVAHELAAIAPVGHVNTTYESIRYRPRWRQPRSNDNYPPSGQMGGYVQLQGGGFDPTGD